jgi:hypothetical protein
MFTACSTSYQAGGASGGYSDTKLDDNMFLVSFLGNSYTENQKAVDFCLLRCSELCLQNGFKYFVIIAGKENSEKSSVTTPIDIEEKISVVGNVARRQTTDYGGATYTFSKPSVSNTILCFKEKPNETSYNASIVLKSVKEKYNME